MDHIQRACSEVRQRVCSNPDRHQAAFFAAFLALLTDIVLAIFALYVNKFETADQPLVRLFPNADNDYNTLLSSGVPIVTAIFAAILCVGNRMQAGVTYISFVIVHIGLIIWNLILVYTIYHEELLAQNSNFTKSESVSPISEPTKTQTHLYAATLIFFAIELAGIIVIVIRGLRYLHGH